MRSKIIFRTLLFVVIAAGVSCGRSNGPAAVTAIDVDIESECDPGAIFEGFHHVILETTDDNLIAGIDKVEISGDRIYVFDERVGNACFIFDRDGRYIGKIHKVGRGPGEYVDAGDMQVHDGLIYLLDRATHSIKVYSETGDFVKEYELKDPFNHFAVLDGNRIWLSSERTNDTGYDFILYDCITGEYIAEVDPFEERNGFIFNFSPFARTDDGSLLVTKRLGHTIYSLSAEASTPLYELKFNTRDQLPEDYESIPAMELYDRMSKQWIVGQLKAVVKKGDDLIVAFDETAGGQIFRHLLRRNDRSGESLHFKLGYQDGKKYPAMSNPVYLGTDYMISPLPAMAAIDLEKHYSWGLFDNAELKQSDNPVLFFWKFK